MRLSYLPSVIDQWLETLELFYLDALDDNVKIQCLKVLMKTKPNKTIKEVRMNVSNASSLELLSLYEEAQSLCRINRNPYKC